jgi:transcriptional regulator with XRE-family HTH domain
MRKKGKTLAAQLRELRKAAGLSQQELATKAGLSMSLVAQLEQGFKDDPRLSTMWALASTLGVTLDELAGDIRPAPKGKKKGR